jgi:hypothetical protein
MSKKNNISNKDTNRDVRPQRASKAMKIGMLLMTAVLMKQTLKEVAPDRKIKKLIRQE